MARTRVFVVGAGIAGVSLACELAVDHSVVVLEAEASLAVYSTGRSAALYTPDYGPPAVRALTRTSESAFDRLAAELGSPPLLPRGGLVTAWDDQSAAGVVSNLKQSGYRLALIAPVAAVTFYDEASARVVPERVPGEPDR